MWRLDFGATIWQISAILHPTYRKIYILHQTYFLKYLKLKKIELKISKQCKTQQQQCKISCWYMTCSAHPPHLNCSPRCILTRKQRCSTNKTTVDKKLLKIAHKRVLQWLRHLHVACRYSPTACWARVWLQKPSYRFWLSLTSCSQWLKNILMGR